MKKTVIILLLTMVVINALVLSAGADEMSFKDVSENNWYYTAVKFVFDEGIMNGITSDTFKPSGETTRAQLVTILARLANAETNGMGEKADFTDVSGDAWYTDSLGWAVESGLVTGYSDGSFKPANVIKRQELATLFARFIDFRGMNISATPLVESFTDQAKIPSWAADAVEVVRKCGIIGGDNYGAFNPANTGTRAEIATMIMRFIQNSEDPMHDKLERILDLTEGEGRYIDINLNIRERVTGNNASYSLSNKILPQLGLDTDTYEILVNSTSVEPFLLMTDYSDYDGTNEPSTKASTLRIAIRNNKTEETTKFKTVWINLTRQQGDPYLDMETFEPGIDPDVMSKIEKTSLYSSGNLARLAGFIEKVKDGQTVSVAYLGGSITRGASGGVNHTYPVLTTNWIRDAFPDATVNYINAGVDGTPSFFGLLRLDASVLKYNPDLFVIEFAANDIPSKENQEAFESIIRKVMKQENDPAIIILIVGAGNSGSAEFMKSIADHYDVALVDSKSAFYEALDEGEIYSTEITYDGSHPREWGHCMMSRFIIYNIKETMKLIDAASPEDLILNTVPEGRITDAVYEDLVTVLPEEITSSYEGWSLIDYDGPFSNVYDKSLNSSDETAFFTYEADCKNLFLLGSGSADIYVDGNLWREGYTFGDLNCSVKLIGDDTAAHHTIEIVPKQFLYEDEDEGISEYRINTNIIAILFN